MQFISLWLDGEVPIGVGGTICPRLRPSTSESWFQPKVLPRDPDCTLICRRKHMVFNATGCNKSISDTVSPWFQYKAELFVQHILHTRVIQSASQEEMQGSFSFFLLRKSHNKLNKRHTLIIYNSKVHDLNDIWMPFKQEVHVTLFELLFSVCLLALGF